MADAEQTTQARPCYCSALSKWPDGYARWWVWMPAAEAEAIVDRLKARGEDAFVEYANAR